MIRVFKGVIQGRKVKKSCPTCQASLVQESIWSSKLSFHACLLERKNSTFQLFAARRCLLAVAEWDDGNSFECHFSRIITTTKFNLSPATSFWLRIATSRERKKTGENPDSSLTARSGSLVNDRWHTTSYTKSISCQKGSVTTRIHRVVWWPAGNRDIHPATSHSLAVLSADLSETLQLFWKSKQDKTVRNG